MRGLIWLVSTSSLSLPNSGFCKMFVSNVTWLSALFTAFRLLAIVYWLAGPKKGWDLCPRVPASVLAIPEVSLSPFSPSSLSFCYFAIWWNKDDRGFCLHATIPAETKLPTLFFTNLHFLKMWKFEFVFNFTFVYSRFILRKCVILRLYGGPSNDCL